MRCLYSYHRGLFWAWHQIRKDGKWISDGRTSENLSFVLKSSGSESCKNQHILNSIVHRVHPIIGNLKEEHTQLKIHKKQTNYRILDIHIKLHPLQKGLSIGGSDDH